MPALRSGGKTAIPTVNSAILSDNAVLGGDAKSAIILRTTFGEGRNEIRLDGLFVPCFVISI